MWGQNFIYIPRKLVNFDKLYETDDQSTYSDNVEIEMYLDDVNGFGGQGSFFSKFSGLHIKDQITLTIAKRRFNEVIQPLTQQPRPMEGDLCFFKDNRKCFQVTYVDNKEMFFTAGALPVFKLTCELLEYSDETFNTGIPEIDSIQKNLSLNVLDNAITGANGIVLTDESGNIIVGEQYDDQNIDPIVDNDDLTKEDQSFIQYNTGNPFGGIANN